MNKEYLERSEVISFYEVNLSNEIINSPEIKSEAVFPTKKYINLKDFVVMKADIRTINMDKYINDNLPLVKYKYIYYSNYMYLNQIKNIYPPMNKSVDFSNINNIMDLAIKKCEEKNIKTYCNKKIALILHLYNEEMWWRIKEKIKILNNKFNTDIYISLSNKKSKTENLIKQEFPLATVLHFDNKGKDIFPFLKTLEYIEKSNKDYDYLIKIHTKRSIHRTYDKLIKKHNSVISGDSWRQNLISSIIGSEEQIKRCLFALEHYNNGLLGSSDFLYLENKDTNYIDIKYIKNMSNKFNFGLEEEKDFSFIAGTMFWVKYKYIKDSFTPEIITNICNEIIPKKNDLNNHGFYSDPFLHSLERFFGIIIKHKYNMALVGISPFSDC